MLFFACLIEDLGQKQKVSDDQFFGWENTTGARSVPDDVTVSRNNDMAILGAGSFTFFKIDPYLRYRLVWLD